MRYYDGYYLISDRTYDELQISATITGHWQYELLM